MRVVTSACVLALAALGTPLAQQGTLKTLPDDPGVLKPWSFTGYSAADLRAMGATAADARAFDARVRAIADVLRVTPVLHPPRGVDAILSGSASVPDGRGQSSAPFQALLLLGSFDHFVIVDPDGREHDKQVAGETSLVWVSINRLPVPGRVRFTDSDGPIMEEPARTGDVGGYPAYGDTIVVSAGDKAPWVPVTAERALKAALAKRRTEAVPVDAYIAAQEREYAAFIAPDAVAARKAKYDAAVAKVAAKGDASATEHERRYWERDEAEKRAALEKGRSRDPKVSHGAAVLAGLKAAEDLLAAMPPATRTLQACYADPGDDALKLGVVPVGAAPCRPLVTPNPEFFDARLPRSVPQIVVVSRFGALEKIWTLGRDAAAARGSLDHWTTYEAVRQADWHGVARLLGK